ncbi:hypothetical protein XM38_028400 [Halomicronema hongdechloris C2206]|uniref:Uncharacterized protein n=1 Tax=Halomicronema hongdechloris C2206 TaxID=1641165 RepID=A0A1Z3HNP0_9CYAN|nr:hypothetical protein [Halomicronema hongdechloris]ASC71886.1 hypothetical protein XM38_028400 [Halomicronema hongdechloris C2206]
MPEFPPIQNMAAVLNKRSFPTITLWNRLEARPRRDTFDLAFKVEVRDALWMLCKQWQMGEFQGDDAGSPIFAKVHMGTTRLTKYQPHGHDPRPFSDDVPLEAQVENRPIPFTIGEQFISLNLRLLMGRHWLKLVNQSIGNFNADYIQQYPIAEPDPNDAADAQICAHPEVWQQVTAVAGRMMDGYAFYRYLMGDPAHRAYDNTSIPVDSRPEVDRLADRFLSWFQRQFYQPAETLGEAWKPSQLEYQFACSAPVADEEMVYVAQGYHQGQLDWYNLDVDPNQRELTIPNPPPSSDPETPDPDASNPQDSAPTPLSFIPVQVSYDGMPNTRWWAFEDRKTNFGDINPKTRDLSKLLFIEFGLVYANDWFLISYPLSVGSIARVKGMAVTNVFGERIWVEPAGRGEDDDWQRWSMFTINTQGQNQEAADLSLLLLPTVPKIQEGRSLEEISLIRDEMANMVWGIETHIPLPSGDSKSGSEAGYELYNHYKRLLGQDIEAGRIVPPPETYNAPIRYQAMNRVPEQWIPFIPVHVENDNRQIQLQRASMPRILSGSPDRPKVKPRTVLLREGLDLPDDLEKQRYFIYEEEVPRAGVKVSQRYQRTRWHRGTIYTWLGVRKQTGRGEGNSGLVFDSLVNVPANQRMVAEPSE